MVHEFELPDIGEGLSEAEILEWRVEPGDAVEEGQIVLEAETDKAVVEVPAPVDGTVHELLADPGDVVEVGAVIITFTVEGENDETPESPSLDDGASGSASAETASGDGEDRVFAAPSARQRARELGVDIDVVAGSGPGGRVTVADVRQAAEEGSAGVAVDGDPDAGAGPPDDGTAVSESTTPGTGVDRDRTLATPAARRVARELDVDIEEVPAGAEREGEAYVGEEDVRAFAEGGVAEATGTVAETGADRAAEAATERVERVPYRGVRRTIGEQMERAAYTAPHVTHHDEVDVTALVEARSRLAERAADRGTDLTYLPFVVKAVVAGLKEHPYLNSELDEENEEILLKHHYDIGIATATDAGLMVPVLEAADEKSLLELARAIGDLVERARDRSITPAEMQGGTFTITNFGAIGGEYATPIVNYPETAILGLGAIKEKPRVVDAGSASAGPGTAEADGSAVVPRKVMTLSLSIDHRVIDGAVGAAFVNTVSEYLATPELLLLE